MEEFVVEEVALGEVEELNKDMVEGDEVMNRMKIHKLIKKFGLMSNVTTVRSWGI